MFSLYVNHDHNFRAETSDINDRWWEARHDDNLNRLVEAALRNNDSLSETILNVGGVLCAAGLLRQDLFPCARSGPSGRPSSGQVIDSRSVRTFGGEMCPAYELTFWEQLALTPDIRHWEYMATAEDQTAVRLILVNNLIDAYYHLAYLTDAVEAARATLRSFRQIQKTFSQNSDRNDPDMHRLRRAVTALEARLLELGTRRREVSENLRQFSGLWDVDESVFSKGILHVSPANIDLEQPLFVLANRPDLKKAVYHLSRLTSNPSQINSFRWLPMMTLEEAIKSVSGRMQSVVNESAGDSLNYYFSLETLDSVTMIYDDNPEYASRKMAVENVLSLALAEIDIYHSAYVKAKENLAHSERRYIRDWEKCVARSSWTTEEPENLIADLSAARNADASRQVMLKNRYQVIQYENMIFKTVSARAWSAADHI
ncbi:hypothetical protein C4J81_17685 [Deltaproteobacteria bacterium Smac51]|nr:hypothetical protein C4J81_17685 [Deltaproteobacteria bacterium Smac51]